MNVNSAQSTCKKCDGRGLKSSSYAPNPAQPNVLKPKDKKCKPCNGMGVIFANKQA